METPGFEVRSTDFGKIQTPFLRREAPAFEKIETAAGGIQARNAGFEKFDAAISDF